MTSPAPTAPHTPTAAAGTGVLAVYIAVAVADVAAQAMGAPGFAAVMTALAMPLLMLWLVVSTPRPWPRPLRAMAVGIIAAWCGDLLLLGDGDLRFALGIAAFAVMQVCYIAAFRRVPGPGMVRAWPVALVPYVLIWLVLVVLMLRGGDPLAVPAALYGLLLVTMAVAALDLVLRVPRRPGWRVAWGALLFVLSDGLIALRAFAGLPGSALVSTVIVATYLAAQAMIVTGFTSAVTARD